MTALETDEIWLHRCQAAAERLTEAASADGPETLGVRMFVCLNLFYWHIAQFESQENPAPRFIALCRGAEQLFEGARSLATPTAHELAKEGKRTGADASLGELYSDVYTQLGDDEYFGEGAAVLRARLETNGIAPEDFFADKVVLDAGCGAGRYTHAIAALGGRQVFGIDLGEGNVGFARAQAAKSPHAAKLHYAVGSVLALPVADREVDLVWCNSVAHVAGDQNACIAELGRVLKPGGTLFYYVNGRFGIFEIMLTALQQLSAGIFEAHFARMLRMLGVKPGRISWIVACVFAPYKFRPRTEVETLLAKHGFTDLRVLSRGHSYDYSERIARGEPFARLKYGEGQLRFIGRKG